LYSPIYITMQSSKKICNLKIEIANNWLFRLINVFEFKNFWLNFGIELNTKFVNILKFANEFI